VVQFLGESLVFSMISLFLALGLVELLMPLFRSNFPWMVNFGNIYTPATLTGFLVLAIMAGILAGSLPAFVLSGFQPVFSLQGTSGVAGSHFRSLLVVFQFTVTISLIANTVIVYRQFDHMMNKSLGYNNRRVAVVKIIDPSIRISIASVKAQLKAHRGIAGVAFTSHPPGGHARSNVFAPQGFPYENMQKMDAVSVDADFVPTLGVTMVAGRNFDSDGTNSNSRNLLINEAAARQFGWKDAVGKTITELTGGMPVKTVIGVIKDFHQRNLYNPIEPLFMENDPAKFNYALVKIHPGNIAETMGFLEKKWRAIDSSGAFDYWFLEDDHASNYRPILQIGALFVGFTLVAILIACMGLFGLALFSAERRTREIGIRKALGATVSDIARMLAQSSIKWVLAANMFAWPLTYWFSAFWLDDYPYRIKVSIGIFSVAGLLALVVALLTVSWQAIKTARKNPVDALRYE
jgi:putative ABC transport system permease protein